VYFICGLGVIPQLLTNSAAYVRITHRRITMKLTLEKNNGEKVTVEFKKDCVTDTELDLSVAMSLEPLWEALKAKLEAKQNG